MLLGFGMLVAVACWAYQGSVWINTGHWRAMPFLPLIDQWLPAPFFVWLNQPEAFVDVSRCVSWTLHNNAGLVMFVTAWLLQLIVKPRG
jgi:hypothetical protein